MPVWSSALCDPYQPSPSSSSCCWPSMPSLGLHKDSWWPLEAFLPWSQTAISLQDLEKMAWCGQQLPCDGPGSAHLVSSGSKKTANVIWGGLRPQDGKSDCGWDRVGHILECYNFVQCCWNLEHGGFALCCTARISWDIAAFPCADGSCLCSWGFQGWLWLPATL